MSSFNALGAYIFAGGFTLGVAQEFNILAHLEDGEFGVPSFKRNFPQVPVYTELGKWPISQFEGVDFLFANPPCIGWSSIGKSWKKGKDGWRNDTRVSCTRVVAGLLHDVKPTVWAFESVQNLMTRGAEVVSDITELAMGLGYHVYYVLHDPKFMGLPQQRRRVFVVASRVVIPWGPSARGIKTSGEALSEVGEAGFVCSMRPNLLDFAAGLGPRQGLREAWERANPELSFEVTKAQGINKVAGRPRFMDHRLDPNLPSSTIVGMVPPAQIHPYEARYLGTNEISYLCGFPQSWIWDVKRPEDIFVEAARGVSPNAGQWLAENVSEGLYNDAAAKPGTTLIDFSGVRKLNKCLDMNLVFKSPYNHYIWEAA